MYMKCGHNLVCTLTEHFNATNKGIMETSFYIKALRIAHQANKGRGGTFGAICLLKDVINLLYEVSGLVKRRVNKAAHKAHDR